MVLRFPFIPRGLYFLLLCYMKRHSSAAVHFFLNCTGERGRRLVLVIPFVWTVHDMRAADERAKPLDHLPLAA